MSRRGGIAALATTCVALAVPASSSAANVSVEELQTEPRQAKLAFVAGPGEANDLAVSVAGEEELFYDLQLLDADTSIEPGPGCSGGGEPGIAVHCKVHKPTPGDDLECFKGCRYTPGTKWELRMTFKLGDAGSRLDTTALPASARDPKRFWVEASPIWVAVTPGAGEDTVLTGPGPDLVESSPGADLIRTGDGSDEFEGGRAADGPDDVDLGPGHGVIDYSERSDGVRYDPNGLADDGSEGEGDNLGSASRIETGAGADTLIAREARSEGLLAGGAGDDTIHGGSGNDEIHGGEGDDELFGGEGDDRLRDPSYSAKGSESGNDTAAGGAGDDEIEVGSGNDVVFGGVGEDRLALGTGDDRAAGDSGRDRIELGYGQDRGTGGAGNDILLGKRGDDEIRGESGEDRLSGDFGRDSLFGGTGDDRIAAGMAVASVLGLREFLGSPGPLEGSPDRVGCGAGRDGAKTGAGDSAAACESTPRAEPLELRELVPSDGYLPPRLRAVIRRPGTLELKGKGLRARQLVSGWDHTTWGIPLSPLGPARQVLSRDGHVKLRLELAFYAAEGRAIVRHRTVVLWLPVGVSGRRRAPMRATGAG